MYKQHQPLLTSSWTSYHYPRRTMIFSDNIRITIHQKLITFPSPPYPRPRFQRPKSHLGSEQGRRAPTPSHPWFASRLVHLSSTSKITIVCPMTPSSPSLLQQREDEEIPEQKVAVAAVHFQQQRHLDSTGAPGTEMPAPRFPFPATSAARFNWSSWQRDASAPHCLFPSTTTTRFNQNSWPRNASALNFLCTPCCTKRQLLSLLGHSKFTLHIIPQG